MSTRLLLVLLILATALPLMLLQGWQIVREYDADVEAARAQVKGLARLTAQDTANSLREIERTLALLARRPSVRALDQAHCDPLLAGFREIKRNIGDVSTKDGNGDPVCSSFPRGAGPLPNVGAEDWFRRLKSGEGFVIGSPRKGAVSQRWVAFSAVPLRSPEGVFGGAVVATIDLLRFLPLVRAALPARAVAAIVDREGVIVTRSEGAVESIGRHVGDTPIGRVVLGVGNGTVTMVGNDGVERLYAFEPVGEAGWLVVTGLATDSLLAAARDRLVRDLAGALLVILLGAGLAAHIYRRVIAPLLGLRETAQAIAAGQTGRRAVLAGPAELTELAGTFNTMMDRLGDTETALREQEAQYRRLFLAAPDAIRVVCDGTVMIANPAAVALFGAGDESRVIGAPLLGSIAPAYRGLARERVTGVLVSGQEFRTEDLEIVRGDGSVAPAAVVLLPFVYAGREAVLSIVDDLTERRRLELAIRDRDAEMERVVGLTVARQTAAAIAHELNQPLAAVLAYSEAALAMGHAGTTPAPKLGAALVGAALQAQRAGTVLHELLDFLRIGDVQVQTFDIGIPLREAAAMIERGADFLPAIRVRIADGLPAVNGHPMQVRKVVSILLHNSADAISQKQHGNGVACIDVGVVREGEMVRISVHDNGRGLAPGTAGQLFEPFFSTKTRGAGMGLWIARSLVESQGGWLWHEAVPIGAIFHFTLPVAA